MFLPTAGTTSLYNTLFAEAFRQRYSLEGNMAFMSLFGNPNSPSRTYFTDDATNVEIKLVKNNATISEFATRGVSSNSSTGSRVFSGETAKTSNRMFPIIKDYGVITAVDTMFKTPMGANMDVQNRWDILREIAEDISYDVIVGQIWKHEHMASQAILTGKLTVDKQGNYFDFHRHADNTISLTYHWSNASSHPLVDIDLAAVRVHRNGLVKPDALFVSNDMYTALIGHADIQKIADIRGFDILFFGDNVGTLQFDQKFSRYIAGGWQPRAIITTSSGYRLTLFTTVEYYVDTDGTTVKDYMPAKTFFVASSQARFDTYVGPDDKLPGAVQKSAMAADELFGISASVTSEISRNNADLFDARMIKTFVYRDKEDEYYKIEHQTAPIYAPVQANGVAVSTAP